MMNVIDRIKSIRRSVMGLNQRDLNLIYPNNARKHYKYADDKYLAKSIMEENGIVCPRTYATVATFGGIEDAWNAVKEWNQMVIKPAKGAGGNGIMILNKKGGQWFKGGKPIFESQVCAHIANIIFGVFSFGDTDVALIEEYVQPHPFFHEIYPEGVPDFRIILLKGIPLMGMLRVPTSRSNGKANLHQGGLGIGVDMKTGKLKSAYDGRKHADHHPDSGSLIQGKSIPFWSELLELSIKASQHFPLDFLGVDLVIDAIKGPMIMEVNVRPGLGIQLANQQGLKEVINELNLNFNEL
ncbi:MAG: sugar-transfer associated ATP-grasp domain-containing protein [Bacteroidota bacterium]